jgi:N-acetylmuramoyl-L-alanine amidase
MNEDTFQTPSSPANKPRRSTRDFSTIIALQTVISVAVIVATLLTFWTPNNLFSDQVFQQLLIAMQTQETVVPGVDSTATPGPRPRIGIVAGHWGYDSGAVCADGLTEEKVNLRIATLVQQYLISEGYEVDLLKEFDDKLKMYQAMAIVSIHNDSCEYYNDEATGFKVAAAMSSPFPEKANRLTSCLVQRYQAATGMFYHYNTITPDMTSYHAFNEINSETTAAIIETGFLNLDREILTEKADLVAKGVTAGILCFTRNEPVNPQEPAVNE